jgi:hypothetical protein
MSKCQHVNKKHEEAAGFMYCLDCHVVLESKAVVPKRKGGGSSARRKGASAERELFAALNARLGHAYFVRNLSQTRAGGCDDGNAEVFALEVKRQESLAKLPAWIQQAQSQAKPGQIPVLAYRRSREPWQFLIVADLEGFANIFEVMIGAS